ncbi:hypothetical protein GCM10009780_79560 [Actinomadura alba]
MVTEAGGVGAVGVADDYYRACREVVDALASAPAGSRGLIHRVCLSYHRTAYVYEGLIARGRFRRGRVVWDKVSPPSAWTHLRPRYSDPDHAIGDAIPPEAFAAGFEDLQTHKERQARTAASSLTDRW